MSTGDALWQSLRSTGFASYNTHNVSGMYYPTDTNVDFAQTEFTRFSTYVPSYQVAPLLTMRCVITGSLANLELIGSSEYNTSDANLGLTFQSLGQQATPTYVQLVDPSAFPGGVGALIHEWGHAIDNQFRFAPPAGGSSPWAFTTGTTWQSYWTRAQTFWAAAPIGQSTFYGWNNQREFWAECFRYHYLGSHGANIAYDGWTDHDHATLSADQQFRELISGVSDAVWDGPDDSYATAVHTLIAGLQPPYPTVVVPTN